MEYSHTYITKSTIDQSYLSDAAAAEEAEEVHSDNPRIMAYISKLNHAIGQFMFNDIDMYIVYMYTLYSVKVYSQYLLLNNY